MLISRYFLSASTNIAKYFLLPADMDADKLLELLGMHEFWLGPFPNITEVFLPAFCYEEPDFCMNIVSLWCGKSDNLNDTRTVCFTSSNTTFGKVTDSIIAVLLRHIT